MRFETAKTESAKINLRAKLYRAEKHDGSTVVD